jgi:hypothetical protein
MAVVRYNYSLLYVMLIHLCYPPMSYFSISRVVATAGVREYTLLLPTRLLLVAF